MLHRPVEIATQCGRSRCSAPATDVIRHFCIRTIVRFHLKLPAKIVVGVLATIGALYVGLAIFLPFLMPDCSSYQFAQMPSPNGTYFAGLSLRRCDDSFGGSVSLWVSDRNDRSTLHSAVISENPSSSYFQLSWKSENELVVQYPYELSIENQVPFLGDVSIEYESMPSGT